MVVSITNLTDAPGKRPIRVSLYNTYLLPGKTLRIPAQYVDEKMKALEDSGFISIGPVPAWYADHKVKRELTAEEVAQVKKHAADVVKAKAAANSRGKRPASKPAPVKKSLNLSDTVKAKAVVKVSKSRKTEKSDKNKRG